MAPHNFGPEEYAQPGLEVVSGDHEHGSTLEVAGFERPAEKESIFRPGYGADGKQAVPISELPQVHSGYGTAAAAAAYTEPAPRRSRKWLLMIAAAVLVLVIIAIAVPVAVTQKNKHSANNAASGPASSQSSTPAFAATSSASSPGSTSTPAPSTPGLSATESALNGTGIATMYPYNDGDLNWLVYQTSTGDLALKVLSTSGAWQASLGFGLTDVLNGSSLEAYSYVDQNLTANYNIFYSSTGGIVQALQKTNLTGSNWTRAPIDGYQTAIPKGAGMRALWSLADYGVEHGVGGGLRLYAGGSDNWLHEYSLDIASGVWEGGFTYNNTNALGGIGITQNTDLTTLHVVNADGNLELWYWAQADTANNDYPAGGWIKGADAKASVHLNSAIAQCTGNETVWFQDTNNVITGIDFYGTQSTEYWLSPSEVGGAEAISGTKIACLYFGIGLNAQEAHVYFQSNSTNIVEFVQNGSGVATFTTILS